MSSRSVSTVIVEHQLLVRDGLSSLLSAFSYRVTNSVGSAAELHRGDERNSDRKLVVLGTGSSVPEAIKEAALIRGIFSDCKIVLLFEAMTASEFQLLVDSEIDGCVPMFVPGDLFVQTLDMVMMDHARVMLMTPIVKHRRDLVKCTPEITRDVLATICPVQAPQSAAIAAPCAVLCSPNATDEPDGESKRATPSRMRNSPQLSDREVQILDGVVRGYANKLIARQCEITEATVKVHMKSILRKIQVSNRTQAAVWALESGFSTEDLSNRLMNAAAIS
jgi:two-component system nitrate/nitrite response regulator NarL